MEKSKQIKLTKNKKTKSSNVMKMTKGPHTPKLGHPTQPKHMVDQGTNPP